jgi:putative transposase
MIELARQYGRYGYRRIAALLSDAGWHVNDKRVERLWRREGLKVPMKQPKKGRLWLNDGSCVRLQPEHRDHVWSYDFVHCRTDDGKAFRTLNIVDEYSRKCLAIRVDRKLNSGNVIDALSDLFILRGIPSFIRSDNGPEFVAQAVRDWIEAVGAKTAYIEPGSPWENGYCESFNARFRDEFLNGEIFYSLREAQILIEEWRKHYNTKRPHSALGYARRPGNHRSDGPKADHALTIKLDHLGGADQPQSLRSDCDGVTQFNSVETASIVVPSHAVQRGQLGHLPSAESIDSAIAASRTMESAAMTRPFSGSAPSI